MRQRQSIGGGDGWFTSSYSGGSGTECVETAYGPERVAVRDSKDVGGPVLTFAAGAWETFLGGVKVHGDRGRGLC